MDGGTLAYGPVSTLAECLQHIAGCTECKGRWPAVPGMLAMTRRPDGHVDFEVSAAGGGLVAVDVAGPGAEPTGLRLLPDSREENPRSLLPDSREDGTTYSHDFAVGYEQHRLDKEARDAITREPGSWHQGSLCCYAAGWNAACKAMQERKP